MAAEQHAPNPVDEVQDMYGHWHVFHDFFGLGEVSVPLLNYGNLGLDRVFGVSPDRPLVTKFMLLELLAAGIVCALFIPLARRMRGGELPRGRWWNGLESILVFVRDEIVKPNIHHGYEKYLPFFWTLFFFILVVNLLGMFPFLGSATASIWVTGALGLIALVMIHGAAIAKQGVVHYFQSLWPHIEVGHPILNKLFELPIFLLEFLGTFVRSFVLAVRLFANMFAGHLVLATFLSFTWAASFTVLWLVVTPASVVAVVALSLLELFVACLQAYIFTFLTALFMGMQMNPEH